MDKDMKILIFGAGAIGSTVGGWIAPVHENLWFFDKPEIIAKLKDMGLMAYKQDEKSKGKRVPVKVVENLADAPDFDLIALPVKNYSLEPVSKLLKGRFDDKPVIMAMQNGIENQKILPKYFSKIIYCVLSYNAWLDEVGVAGYQKRGPLVIGAIDNKLQDEMKAVSAVFNRGVETIVTDHFQDAARSKMIVNLTNSLTTLVGHGFREISDMAIFQKLLTNLMFEGVRIVKTAGYKECDLGGMPSWIMISAGAKLPGWLTQGMFKRNVKKMVMSSMAQDIIQRGGSDSELETINGYFIELADKHGMKVPYNRAIYALCKREFAKPKFEPLDVKEVMEEVEKKIQNGK